MWDTDWIRDSYDVLAAHIERHGEGIDREQAYEVLMADDEFEDEPADAKYAVRRLLSRGWLYEVDGELHITESEP